MLQYFSRIAYGFSGDGFSGGTFSVVNIFKNVKLDTGYQGAFFQDKRFTTIQRIDGERPDQFSNRIYNNSEYFWTVFLANNIRNPLLEWNGTNYKTDLDIRKKYPGIVYQFGNTSRYNPPTNQPGYTNDIYDVYKGIDLNRVVKYRDEIKAGQYVLFETGDGYYSIRCFGAGQLPHNAQPDQPHQRQSYLPWSPSSNFYAGITATKQLSCGAFNSAVLTDKHLICWGQNVPGFTGMIKSQDNRGSQFAFTDQQDASKKLSYIDCKRVGLVGIKNSDGGLTCYGSCGTFNSLYTGTTGYTKIAWNQGLTAGVAIKSNGTPTYFGSLTVPSGISLFDIACNETDCIAIDKTNNYGVTAWGPNKNNLFLGFNQGITGITAIALGFNHFLALKDNGTIYGGGITFDGQLDIPQGYYSQISAGKYHSAALTTLGKMVVWGKIANSYSSPIGTQLNKVTPKPLSGIFSKIASGAEHIITKETGTNKKFVGIIDSVDDKFKRLIVKHYKYPEMNPTQLDENDNTDPAGNSLIIANSLDEGAWLGLSFRLQHQTIAIQPYFESTKKIMIQGVEADPSTGTIWKDVYLPGYTNADNRIEFITIKKEAENDTSTQNSNIQTLNKNIVGKVVNLVSSKRANNQSTIEIQFLNGGVY